LKHARHMWHASHMPRTKMIQVRNVPEKLHRELVRRAQAQGLTLTDYITRILEREVRGRSTNAEIIARVRARGPIDLGDMTPAELVRQARREAAEYPDDDGEA